MTGTDENMVYRMAFASLRGMGIELAERLLEVLPDEKTFFDMSERDLQQLTSSRNKMLERGYRNQQLERARRELDFVLSKNIGVTYFKDSDFPNRLKQAPDAPLLLYCLGSCDLNSQKIVSIVGTRKSTAYGSAFCDTFIKDLVEAVPGVVIVSGLAYGTDINAHRAALRYNTPTVAVQACGLNRIYPGHHRNDAVAIVRQGGMIVSDYQSQDEIHRGNFLARNRIIAALSDCTVIVESADHGGSLVTARIAQSYDRDVFAVPGRTGDEFSKGTNRIIMQNNAALITCADDLLHAMRWQSKRQEVANAKQLEIFQQLTEREQKVLNKLKSAGKDLHVNELAGDMGLPLYKLMSTLVELDAKKLIITLPGCRYSAK